MRERLRWPSEERETGWDGRQKRERGRLRWLSEEREGEAEMAVRRERR